MSDEKTANTVGKVIITATTLIPIGIAVAVIVAVLALKTWIDAQFVLVTTDIRDLKIQMLLFQTEMKEKTSDRWTSRDMRLFVSETARKNPSLVMPSVNEIVGGRESEK